MHDSFALARLTLALIVRPLVFATSAFIGVSVTYVLYILICRRISAYRSPLRNVPGPEGASWFKGNFTAVQETDSTRLQEEWVRKHGHVLKFQSLLWTQRLMAVDPVAVSYILQNGDSFHKSEFLRFSLGVFIGKGVLFLEGPQHKKQRRVMTPAFGPVQVRKFTSLFLEKSLELREIWVDLLSKSSRKDGKKSLDVYMWLNRVTLDIIGLTGNLLSLSTALIALPESHVGFNYAFDSLHSPAEEKKTNDTYRAIRSVLTHAVLPDPFFPIQYMFPMFRLIPTRRSRVLNRAFKEIQHTGSQLIQDRKTDVHAECDANGSGVVGRQDVGGHDLLSLLIKANMAADIPESMRMSDSEILSQVPTFLLAGHETSSTAVSWALFALACHPTVQAKFRAELRTCPTDSPTMEQLNSLPYLEGVVREVLRLYAPVSGTQRIAMHDVEIPLQKPFTDKQGVLRGTVRMSKGDLVVIPIRLLNRSTEVWGEDANEFRPERWDDVPDAANRLPSIYGHLMTFIAGAHACIGYRFAVVEIKALLFTLVRTFEFELALEPEDIIRKTGIVGRPIIASNPSAGPQLPLLIRLANTD
ncbi:cytochrome P450 [Russula emetica]|nr:cytochrome P450 [Russula emetica]